MIDIEVTVTCDKCGNTASRWCDDEWQVGHFLDSLDGWADELSICPDCASKTFECSKCGEYSVEGTTEDELEDIGWSQFMDAKMQSLITYCKECTREYNLFRS